LGEEKYKLNFKATNKRMKIIMLRHHYRYFCGLRARHKYPLLPVKVMVLWSKPIRSREILKRTRDDKELPRDNDIHAWSLPLSTRR
jgi:hypothetical protein